MSKRPTSRLSPPSASAGKGAPFGKSAPFGNSAPSGKAGARNRTVDLSSLGAPNSPPSPPPARSRSGPALGPLLACLALYAVLTLGLIFTVPFGKAPDEGAHYEYVTYLAQKGHFPTFSIRGDSNSAGYEFHQPPAYYALGALAYKAAPVKWRTLAVRGVSLLCGLGVLACAWFGVAALFPSRRELPPLVTGLLALSPLHQGIGAAVGNDALAGMLSALVFCFIARLSTRPSRPFDAAILGLLAGLAMLSKSTTLVLAPICVGAAWYFSGRSVANRARDALLCLAVFFMVYGPWLWRNQTLYGDVLAQHAFNVRFANNGSRIENFKLLIQNAPDIYLRAVGQTLFCTTWGVLGGPNTSLSLLNPFNPNAPLGLLRYGAWVTFGTLALMLCCAGATLCSLLGLMRTVPHVTSWPTPAKKAFIWWGLGLVLVGFAFLRFNLEFFQAQARYLHPAIVPLALLFVLGWRETFGKRVWIVSAIFGLVLLESWAWNVFGWRTLV